MHYREVSAMYKYILLVLFRDVKYNRFLKYKKYFRYIGIYGTMQNNVE